MSNSTTMTLISSSKKERMRDTSFNLNGVYETSETRVYSRIIPNTNEEFLSLLKNAKGEEN